MSAFYDLASLVLVPSGYKASKVYAQKPLTTDGQLAFTRASTATRVGPDGLIEKVRTNLLTYSNNFSNAAWTKTNVTLTTGQADPNGGLTATTVDATNGTSAFVRQNISITSGVKYAWSVYIKGSTTGQNIALYTDGASNIYEIKALTTSWQRFTGVATAASSGSSGFYILCGSGYSGLTDLPFDIAFGQTEVSDFGATPYIPTTTAAVSVGMLANVPRLDYLGGGCPKLLLEPQRVNLAFFSEQFNNAYWTKTGGTTITANTTISPDGFLNADTIAFAGSGDSINLFISSGLSVVSGTTYTMSVFTKSTTQVIFFGGATGGTGTNVFNGSVDYGNGWYRQSITRTWSASGSVSVQLVLSFGIAGTSAITYGFQAELGSYATSYIPTLGAAVTRSADAASKTGISALIGQTEGTLFVEVNANITGVNQSLELGDGTGNNRVTIRMTGNSFQLVVVQAGSAVFNQTSVTTFSQGQNLKIAAVYKSGAVSQMFVNGVSVLTGTAGSITGSFSGIFTGQDGNAFSFMNSPIEQILVFKTALTNAQAIELTA